MKIAIIGRTQILYDTIELLEKGGHEIVYIATAKAAPEYTKNEKEFEDLAHKLNAHFWLGAKIKEDSFYKENKVIADVAISMNWPNVLDEEVIGRFKFGILNAHCGDLPRYRGNACPNWAIINGEKKMGIAIHFMLPDKLDAGDVVIKEYCEIDKRSISEVYRYIERVIPQLFVRAVCALENGSGSFQKQSIDPLEALRCYPRIPSDSFIDWNTCGETIERLVRASCWPFQGAYTYLNDKKIYILRASVKQYECPSCVIPGQVVEIDPKTHRIGVACKDGIVLVERIRVENETECDPDEVIKSLRTRLGFQIQNEIYELKKRVEKLENKLGWEDSE